MKTDDSLKAQQNTGYLCILAAGVLWGSIGFFVRELSLLGAGGMLASFMRIFSAWVILVPLLFFLGRHTGINYFKISKKGLLQCLFLGICTQALFNAAYSNCINTVGVGAASVLLYTEPVFVCVFSRMLFKEQIGPRKGISLVINLLGCFLMVTGGDLSVLKGPLTGILCGIASGFLYSLITIVGKVTMEETHPFTLVFYNFLFGWIALAVMENPVPAIAAVSSPAFWLLGFGFGLIPTVGSYLFYMSGISKGIELTRAPIIASVEPIVAALIGLLLFHESLGPVNTIGLAAVLFSIVLMNTGKN
ncbi:MAG: DMT family transporter [Clostridiales bacterium]|nr:DMT family transporter [Clostridiales bacterium]